MKVLIAAQEFKGSLSAAEACEAIALGIRDGRPDWELDVVPLADGGPGFLDAFRRAADVREHIALAQDALGRPVESSFLTLRSTGDVIIEAAQANGLTLIHKDERDALASDTEGVGQMITAALPTTPRKIVVGVGGTATSDGGAGMARSLGASLLDSEGRPLERGVLPLLDLARIEWNPGKFSDHEWLVATDVRSPLLGRAGAAAVFGPQKGASPAQVAQIEAALARWASVISRDLGIDVAAMPGAGAGGGLAAGLVAFVGGTITSGFELVEEITGLSDRVCRADLVVTGEGAFDRQSLAGKGPGRLLELARREGVPSVVFAGTYDGSDGSTMTLSSLEPSLADSMANAASLLTQLVRQWSAAFAG